MSPLIDRLQPQSPLKISNLKRFSEGHIYNYSFDIREYRTHALLLVSPKFTTEPIMGLILDGSLFMQVGFLETFFILGFFLKLVSRLEV